MPKLVRMLLTVMAVLLAMLMFTAPSFRTVVAGDCEPPIHSKPQIPELTVEPSFGMARLDLVTEGPLNIIVEEVITTGEADPIIEPDEALDEHEPVLQISGENANQQPTKRYLGRFYVTGYDICIECCGKLDGITASGAMAQVGRTIAAPADIPFGTTLYIEEIGERVVEDRGGLVTGNRLDVLCKDHPACYAVTGWHDVYVLEDAT